MTINSSDPNAGKAQTASETTVSAFVTSVVTFVGMFLLQIIVFTLLRNINKRIYQPRTFVETIPEKRRVPKLSLSPFAWLIPVFTTSPEEVIFKVGLDGYFFLRFLWIFIKLFAGALVITWPILLPLNKINGKGTSGVNNISGLDVYAFGNIRPENKNRYWGHAILACIFVGFILFTFYHELRDFISLRQRYLTSSAHKYRAGATTILVTTIPHSDLHEDKLKEIFSVFPAGVKNVWINRDCEALLDKVKERDSIAKRLESAECDVIKLANKRYRQYQKKIEQGKVTLPIKEVHSCSTLSQWVPRNKRPTHRLPIFSWMISLPLIGKKVDTIEWCRTELAQLNREIEQEQAEPERAKQMNSAFIQFHSQIAAHMAAQCVAHEKSQFMTPRYIEIAPDDVIWENMRLLWWERYIRFGITIAAAICLIIFWAIPSAFIGGISSIDALTSKLPALKFVYNLPQKLQGIITGVLPVVLLSIAMALPPIIFRALAKQQGHPTNTQVELMVQKLYFPFVVIQVFLVLTISQGVSKTIASVIDSPSNATNVLAGNLPGAANFFFSWTLAQGFTVSAGALLQVSTLILFFLFGKLFDNTPRKKWFRFTRLPGLGWGTTFPAFANIAVIGITYSMIAPLILVIVAAAMSLFYCVYKYNLLYVYDFQVDTGGLAFPLVLYQTLTGVYLLEICLIGLFFIAQARAQAIVMIAALIFTVIFQILLGRWFDPLTEYIPITLSPPEPEGQGQGKPRYVAAERDVSSLDENFFQQLVGNMTPELREQLVARAYAHYALRAPKPIIWIPEDSLGISKEEIAACKELGEGDIEMTDEGASIDEEGNLRVIGKIPDWLPSFNEL